MSERKITLMTLHAAKGWNSPWLCWLGWKRACSHIRARLIEPDQIEEERRLCYVGMTRAMDTLVLSPGCISPPPYGTDMPEASVAVAVSGLKVPVQLVEEMAESSKRVSSAGVSRTGTSGLKFARSLTERIDPLFLRR